MGTSIILINNALRVKKTGQNPVEIKMLALEEEITDYYCTTQGDGDILPALSIERLIYRKDVSNKYFLSMSVEENVYYCAYLDKSAKNVLDEIEITYLDDDVFEFLWEGKNGYLKKYEIGKKNNAFSKEDYSLVWMKYENEKDIQDEYANMFLICVAKQINVEITDYLTREKFTKQVYINTDALEYYGNIYNWNQYFLLTEDNLIEEEFTTRRLLGLIEFFSLECKWNDGEAYINSRKKDRDQVISGYNYLIYDDYYYLKLSEILGGK